MKNAIKKASAALLLLGLAIVGSSAVAQQNNSNQPAKVMVVLFNLKPNVSVADYEKWAASTDAPAVRSNQSVDRFRVLKPFALMGSQQKPPYQYIEIVEINDLDLLGKEVQSEKMQKIVKQFQVFADNPLFILTDSFVN